jgi:CheY-like chemotaxis protein
MAVAHPLEILLVDDSAADIRPVKEGLDECPIPYRLQTASKGEEASMRISESPSAFNLIILDLNMPGANGYDLLRRLKTDECTDNVPVVIFSSSKATDDIERAYGLLANGYVAKPDNLDDFLATIKAIKGFWARVENSSARGRSQGEACNPISAGEV